MPTSTCASRVRPATRRRRGASDGESAERGRGRAVGADDAVADGHDLDDDVEPAWWQLIRRYEASGRRFLPGVWFPVAVFAVWRLAQLVATYVAMRGDRPGESLGHTLGAHRAGGVRLRRRALPPGPALRVRQLAPRDAQHGVLPPHVVAGPSPLRRHRVQRLDRARADDGHRPRRLRGRVGGEPGVEGRPHRPPGRGAAGPVPVDRCSCGRSTPRGCSSPWPPGRCGPTARTATASPPPSSWAWPPPGRWGSSCRRSSCCSALIRLRRIDRWSLTYAAAGGGGAGRRDVEHVGLDGRPAGLHQGPGRLGSRPVRAVDLGRSRASTSSTRPTTPRRS